MTIRVGIVGLSLMGRRHGAILDGTPTDVGAAETVLAVDRDPAARRRWADTGFRGRVVAELTDAMLDGVDCLVVALPDNAHTEVVVRALTRGVPVLVEKPLATGLADARAIVAASRASQTPIMVGNLLRYDPRYREAARRIRTREIGDLVHVSARRFSAIGSAARYGTSTSLPWHVAWHDLDQVTTFTRQRFASVLAIGRSAVLAPQGHLDSIAALFALADGTPVVIEAGWTLPARHGPAIDSRLDVLGTAGTVQIRGEDEGLRVAGVDHDLYPDVLRYLDDAGPGAGGALAAELWTFLQRVAGHQAWDPGEAADALAVIAAITAVEQSLAIGGRVAVEPAVSLADQSGSPAGQSDPNAGSARTHQPWERT